MPLDGDIDTGTTVRNSARHNISINTLVVGQRLWRTCTLVRCGVNIAPNLGRPYQQFGNHYAYHPSARGRLLLRCHSRSTRRKHGLQLPDLVIQTLEMQAFVLPHTLWRTHSSRPQLHYINAAFRGESSEFLRPTFNTEACDDLITAIELYGLCYHFARFWQRQTARRNARHA